MSVKNVRPFGARDKWGYSLGDMGCNFSFQLVSTYMQLFYCQLIGVKPEHTLQSFLFQNSGMLSTTLSSAILSIQSVSAKRVNSCPGFSGVQWDLSVLQS